MTVSTKTDRIRRSFQIANEKSSDTTRTHIDSLMRDENKILNDRKAEGCKCRTCKHISTKGYFSLCTLKDRLVNSLALCHKWASKS